jgi:hypothetical protein
MAAVSSNEAWIATPNGLFRFDGQAWHPELVPGDAAVEQLAVGPDGELWAATDAGPMVFDRGEWAEYGDAVQAALGRATESAPVPCLGSAVFVEPDGIGYYIGPRSGDRVVRVRHRRGSLPIIPITSRATETCGPTQLAVSHGRGGSGDDSIWLARASGTPLRGEFLRWRLDGQAWQTWGLAFTSAGRECFGSTPTAIATDHVGSLWAAGDRCPPDDAVPVVFAFRGGQYLDYGDPSIGPIADLAFTAGGSLIAVGDGLAVRDEPSWHSALPGVALGQISVGRDGSVWVAGKALYRLPRPLDLLPFTSP